MYVESSRVVGFCDTNAHPSRIALSYLGLSNNDYYDLKLEIFFSVGYLWIMNSNLFIRPDFLVKIWEVT